MGVTSLVFGQMCQKIPPCLTVSKITESVSLVPHQWVWSTLVQKYTKWSKFEPILTQNCQKNTPKADFIDVVVGGGAARGRNWRTLISKHFQNDHLVFFLYQNLVKKGLRNYF